MASYVALYYILYDNMEVDSVAYLEVHGTYEPIMTVLITYNPLASPLSAPIWL